MAPYTSPELYGIIGHPIKHSLSPLLHTTAFRALGIPGVLLPWDIVPEQLPAFAQSIRVLNIRGCCITIPNKKGIIPLADRVSEQARAVGAANTMYREGEAVCLDNTDVAGFVSALRGEDIPPSASVLLLGAGGAARAAAVGLIGLGCKNIGVASRSGSTASALAEEFSLASVPWQHRGDFPARLVVNTTPLGMKGGLENETPYEARWLAGRAGTVYDMIYTPLETRLLRDAAAAGWRAIAGLGMFLGQAECQFRRWTGQALPPAAREAVARALYGDKFEMSRLSGLI